MGKVLSIFIDESGDVGFIKDASKYIPCSVLTLIGCVYIVNPEQTIAIRP